MKPIGLSFFVAAVFVACAQSAPVPAPTLTLIPLNGQVAGAPGSVIGWGFTLTYSASSDWVVLTGSNFTGSPVYGTYKDYLSLPNAPLYVAGPAPESSTVQEAWNSFSNPPLGLGEFDINTTALVGAKITGNIVVHYSVFTQDPNDPTFDPDTSTAVADATLAAPAQVNVSPEPSSLWMMSAVLIPLAWAGWRRGRLAFTK